MAYSKNVNLFLLQALAGVGIIWLGDCALATDGNLSPGMPVHDAYITGGNGGADQQESTPSLQPLLQPAPAMQVKPQAATQTNTNAAQPLTQMAPSAGYRPERQVFSSYYRDQASAANQQAANMQDAPQTYQTTATQAADLQPQQGQPLVTEQVIYPPEQQTAPQPVQRTIDTPPGVAGAGTQQQQFQVHPAPRLVWVEGPSGQIISKKQVKEKSNAKKKIKGKKTAAKTSAQVEKKSDAENVTKAKAVDKKAKIAAIKAAAAEAKAKAAEDAKAVADAKAKTAADAKIAADAKAKTAAQPVAGTVPPPPVLPPVSGITPPLPPSGGSLPPFPPPPAGAVPPPPPPPPPGAVPPPPPPPVAPPALPPAGTPPAVSNTPEPPAAKANEPVINMPTMTAPPAASDSAAVAATTKAIAAPASALANTGKPVLTIAFKSTESTVPLSVNDDLNKLAKQLVQNDNQRVTLIAYAAAVGDQVSTARRISLSRALSVRAYLIDAGVNNLRINVQAEGDKNPGGDPDRVDLVVQSVTDDKTAP